MADQDLTLTFDPKLFTTAINQIVDKLTGMEKKLGSVVGSTTKMEQHGAKSIGIWTAAMTGALGLIKAGVSKIMSFIPEIGKSFQIVSDIIGRNLLWPLRQELIPILQGMLNWVRDNRAMFVRWGMVIANVFRVVVGIVKNAWEMWSKLFERLFKGMKKLFGNTVKSVTDILNIILFKIAVVMIAVQLLMEPVLEFLVDAWLMVAKYAKAFWDGMMRGMSGVGRPLAQIVEELGNFFNLMKELFGGLTGLTAGFESLGAVLGGTIMLALTGLVTILKTINFLVAEITDAIAFAQANSIADPVKRRKAEQEVKDRIDKRRGGFVENVTGVKPLEGETGVTESDWKEKAEAYKLRKQQQPGGNVTLNSNTNIKVDSVDKAAAAKKKIDSDSLERLRIERNKKK